MPGVSIDCKTTHNADVGDMMRTRRGVVRENEVAAVLELKGGRAEGEERLDSVAHISIEVAVGDRDLDKFTRGNVFIWLRLGHKTEKWRDYGADRRRISHGRG